MDRERRINQIDFEKEYNETGEAIKLSEEEEKTIEEILNSKEADTFQDEESRELFIKQLRVQHISKLFHEKEEWKKGLLGLKDATVLKMPRILQSVFYLLQFKREEVC